MQHKSEPTLVAAAGALIALRRRTMRKSQDQLAKVLGVTRGAMGNLELGRQTIYVDQLWDLARSLEIELAALLPDPDSLRTSRPGRLRSLSSKAISAEELNELSGMIRVKAPK